jgi:hypothetical protein
MNCMGRPVCLPFFIKVFALLKNKSGLIVNG